MGQSGPRDRSDFLLRVVVVSLCHFCEHDSSGFNRDRVRANLSWCLERPVGGESTPMVPLEYRIHAQRLRGAPTVEGSVSRPGLSCHLLRAAYSRCVDDKEEYRDSARKSMKNKIQAMGVRRVRTILGSSPEFSIF